MAKNEKANTNTEILEAAIKVRAKQILRTDGPKGVMGWLKDMPAESAREVSRLKW